jgi:hypothetical protein
MFSTWKAYFLRPLCTFAASARTITGRYDDEGATVSAISSPRSIFLMAGPIYA